MESFLNLGVDLPPPATFARVVLADRLSYVPEKLNLAERPHLRRDAAQNRQRILDAAARLIGEHGLDISHDQIAREAKVGVGTVYRRFPSRAQLFDAVYYEQLDQMVAVAEQAAEHDDPWDALEFFFVRTFEQQAANRGLRELLIGHAGTTELARRAQERVSPIIANIVARAHQAGELKSSVGATDMALIPVMINALIRASQGIDPELWRRWLAILLEGMADGTRQDSFPGAPPTPDKIARLIGTTPRTRPPGR